MLAVLDQAETLADHTKKMKRFYKMVSHKSPPPPMIRIVTEEGDGEAGRKNGINVLFRCPKTRCLGQHYTKNTFRFTGAPYNGQNKSLLQAGYFGSTTRDCIIQQQAVMPVCVCHCLLALYLFHFFCPFSHYQLAEPWHA